MRERRDICRGMVVKDVVKSARNTEEVWIRVNDGPDTPRLHNSLQVEFTASGLRVCGTGTPGCKHLAVARVFTGG